MVKEETRMHTIFWLQNLKKVKDHSEDLDVDGMMMMMMIIIIIIIIEWILGK